MKYCKKLFALLAAALLCMALTLPAGVAAPLVRDECGVFDADTLADLEEQAESASDGHDVDVYFLVVDDIGDADQRDYAKNYYIANGLGYGLVAGVHTRDIGRALKLAARLEAGSVWINGWSMGGVQAPTGGIKDSGIGKERGLAGVRNYLHTKNVAIRL